MKSKKYEIQLKEYNNNPNLCLFCGKPIYCNENTRLNAIKKRNFAIQVVPLLITIKEKLKIRTAIQII